MAMQPGKADQMAALDSMLAGAGPPPPPGEMGGAGGVLCQVCGVTIDPVTGAPVEGSAPPAMPPGAPPM